MPMKSSGPVIVNSIQWTGQNGIEISQFFPGAIITSSGDGLLKIEQSKQTIYVSKGDTIAELSDESIVTLQAVERKPISPAFTDDTKSVLITLMTHLAQFSWLCDEISRTTAIEKIAFENDEKATLLKLETGKRILIARLNAANNAIYETIAGFMLKKIEPLKLPSNIVDDNIKNLLIELGIDPKTIQ